MHRVQDDFLSHSSLHSGPMLDLSCTARDERDRYFCHLLKEIVTQKRVHAHAQDARDHTTEKMDSARAGRLTECCSDLPRGAARAAESSDSAAYVELSKSAAAFFSRTLTPLDCATISASAAMWSTRRVAMPRASDERRCEWRRSALMKPPRTSRDRIRHFEWNAALNSALVRT